MTFPGVSQPESNDYFPPLAKIRIAFDHVFFDLFSIIAFWYARTTRHVILYNLRKKSADDLNFWWSYCNFCPRPVTNYFPSYLSLGRVPVRGRSRSGSVEKFVKDTVLEILKYFLCICSRKSNNFKQTILNFKIDKLLSRVQLYSTLPYRYSWSTGAGCDLPRYYSCSYL